MKSKLAILAIANAIASPFLALTPAKRVIRKRNKEAEAATIAKAEAKRLRKQQKRLGIHAPSDILPGCGLPDGTTPFGVFRYPPELLLPAANDDKA